jgi:two-component system phosphate regulon sensor histidine kinase PhoR
MSTLAWALAALMTVAAVGLFIQWRRAASAGAEAELGRTQAERTLRDVSQALEQHRGQLQALLAAQLEAVLIVGGDRTLLDMNGAARELFGAQAKTGQTVILVTRSVELDELVAAALAGEAECDRRMPLGRTHQPYRARAVRTGDPLGAGGGVVVWLQDQSELQRLGRARRDFVANISHELRTPITAIRLLVDTLRGPSAGEGAARDGLLEKISVETEALAQLSQELLDLAQIESGQTLVRLVPTPVADIIAGVVNRFGPLAERKGLRMEVGATEGLTALADLPLVTRALGNLVHNAIKFTPAGGRVRLSAEEVEGDVGIQVADTGPGIAPEDVPRVFERFFRADRSRASGGTGLGLAIARHVVEAHGGRIWVASGGGLGHGAVFRFTLPAANEPATPQPDAPPA